MLSQKATNQGIGEAADDEGATGSTVRGDKTLGSTDSEYESLFPRYDQYASPTKKAKAKPRGVPPGFENTQWSNPSSPAQPEEENQSLPPRSGLATNEAAKNLILLSQGGSLQQDGGSHPEPSTQGREVIERLGESWKARLPSSRQDADRSQHVAQEGSASVEPASGVNKVVQSKLLSMSTANGDSVAIPVYVINGIPDRPAVISSNFIDRFNEAARTLKFGHLVKEPSFSLYDGIGALEIMDPKMDSGIETNGEDQEDDCDYDVTLELTLEQVIGVMDDIFCFEMSWHQGFPLSQTLFSSHFIHNLLESKPRTIEEVSFDFEGAANRKGKKPAANKMVNLVLRAYCISVVKACDFAHRRITTEKFYDEEDFSSNLYERSLLSQIRQIEVLELLEEASRYVSEQQDADEEDGRLTAIEDRLALRCNMLLAMHDEDNLVNGRRVAYWQVCLELVSRVGQTHELGQSVIGSYSQRLQWRLASTTPPKPLVKAPMEEAVSMLGELVVRAVEAYAFGSSTNTENMLTFVRLFASRNPPTPVYIRSLLQTLLWHDNLVIGKLTYLRFVFNGLEASVLPASNLVDVENQNIEVPHDPRFKIAQIMEEFARKVADPFLDIFVNLCMNRPRARRTLIRDLEKWDTIEREFNPLEGWARRHKIRQMMWIIQLGFELDLYQAEELSTMYWLLSNYASAYVHVISSIQEFHLAKRTAKPELAPSKREALNESLHQLEVDLCEAMAVYHLAAALSNLYIFLNHVAFIEDPFYTGNYSSQELRYDIRMRPFISIADPPCPKFEEIIGLVTAYPHYSPDVPADRAEAVSDFLSASERAQGLGILALAAENFAKAKTKWAAFNKMSATDAHYIGTEDRWKQDVRKTFMACIQGSVAHAQAERGMAVSKETGLDISGLLVVEVPRAHVGHHEWWIVPRIYVKEPEKEAQEEGKGKGKENEQPGQG